MECTYRSLSRLSEQKIFGMDVEAFACSFTTEADAPAFAEAWPKERQLQPPTFDDVLFHLL